MTKLSVVEQVQIPSSDSKERGCHLSEGLGNKDATVRVTRL